MNRRLRITISFITLSLLLTACAAPVPIPQSGPGAEVISGDLHRVDNASVTKAYVDPAFNIDDYEKIFIAPLDVSSIAVINPDYSRSDASWQLNDEDRAFLAQRYRTSMIKNFFGLGGYVAATGPGEGVLQIRVALSRVGPAISERPAVDSVSRRNLTGSIPRGGEVQITGIVVDSGTGKPVARFIDIRNCPSNWALSNALTNREDAVFLFESWARLFVFRLQVNREQNRGSGKVW